MVIGAIGTMDPLRPPAATWLAANLRHWLARWDVRLAYANLEGDAGRLWVQVLIAACIPYRVVVHASTLTAATQPYLDQASAVHLLELDEPNDSWEQMQSASDVMIGMAAAPHSGSPILRSLEAACVAHCAAVLLDHAGQTAQILCRHGKW